MWSNEERRCLGNGSVGTVYSENTDTSTLVLDWMCLFLSLPSWTLVMKFTYRGSGRQRLKAAAWGLRAGKGGFPSTPQSSNLEWKKPLSEIPVCTDKNVNTSQLPAATGQGRGGLSGQRALNKNHHTSLERPALLSQPCHLY